MTKTEQYSFEDEDNDHGQVADKRVLNAMLDSLEPHNLMDIEDGQEVIELMLKAIIIGSKEEDQIERENSTPERKLIYCPEIGRMLGTCIAAIICGHGREWPPYSSAGDLINYFGCTMVALNAMFEAHGALYGDSSCLPSYAENALAELHTMTGESD